MTWLHVTGDFLHHFANEVRFKPEMASQFSHLELRGENFINIHNLPEGFQVPSKYANDVHILDGTPDQFQFTSQSPFGMTPSDPSVDPFAQRGLTPYDPSVDAGRYGGPGGTQNPSYSITEEVGPNGKPIVDSNAQVGDVNNKNFLQKAWAWVKEHPGKTFMGMSAATILTMIVAGNMGGKGDPNNPNGYPPGYDPSQFGKPPGGDPSQFGNPQGGPPGQYDLSGQPGGMQLAGGQPQISPQQYQQMLQQQQIANALVQSQADVFGAMSSAQNGGPRNDITAALWQSASASIS